MDELQENSVVPSYFGGKKDCASLHVLNKNKKEKKDLEVNQKK